MWNKRYNWGYVLSMMLVLASCHDSSMNQDEPDYPGLDRFEGRIKEFFLTDETDRFDATDCEIKILAPDSSVISRRGTHSRAGGRSTFQLETGLKEGNYRLLYIEYPIDPIVSEDGKHTISTRQFGLGCSISADDNEVTVTSSFDPVIGLSGCGTKENPYIVSSYDHLMTLAHKVNSEAYNSLFTDETYIRQIVDIDMDDACFFTDHRYGWEPIGNDCNLPFRGVYQGGLLSNMWCLRDKSPGIGLFGYIHRAKIDGVKISQSVFSGNFAVGTVAGAVITSGANRDRSEITNCRVIDSTVKGSDGSLAIGGILGTTDMNSRIMLYECHNENTKVSGDYNAGGIMGSASAYTLSSINNCTNSGRVTSAYSGSGGIIGSCDTIYVTSCSNFAEIIGGNSYSDSDGKHAATGTGGIVGGAGMAFLTGCSNSAPITGVDGVGGILGSCRVTGDADTPLIYNNAAFRYCSNYAEINGKNFVGGICGESQIGTFGVINRGNVEGDSYIGGIAGNSSIAVIHNAVNAGKVKGKDCVAGIIGKTTFASIVLDDNYGEISATGNHTAGIVGLSGNNTIVHYCGNHGDVINTSGNHVGGIVGEVGDPRKWTAMNITECVIAAAEIAMAAIGPCISVAEHALEESMHALSLVLKYGEFAFDSLLHATDAVLWADAMAEIASGETSEEVSLAIKTATLNLADDINREIKSIRSDRNNYKLSGLSYDQMYITRTGCVAELVDWYSQEGNDDLFNDAINEAREKRMEQNEKAEHAKEIVHQCIGGVCVVAGTVASIGATVLSGGAATAFLVAGCAISVVGGVNAIVKTCTEFEANVAIISQCVNSGEINGWNSTGGLAGTLQDRTIMRDCLNVGVGHGSAYPFASRCGTGVEVHRCLSAGTGWKRYDVNYEPSGESAVRIDGSDNPYTPHFNRPFPYISEVDGPYVNDPDVIKNIESSWILSTEGESGWKKSTCTDQGLQYPVPAHSEMKK